MAAVLILSIGATVAEEAEAKERIPAKDKKNQEKAAGNSDIVCTSNKNTACCGSPGGGIVNCTHSKGGEPVAPLVIPKEPPEKKGGKADAGP